MNDRVFQLEPTELIPPLDAQRFRRLSLGFVRHLGRELFAEQPMLQQVHPGRAERLAALIAAKAPAINAALFVAPSVRCATEKVSCRFAEVPFEIMVGLHKQELCGEMSNIAADNQVWKRLAA